MNMIDETTYEMLKLEADRVRGKYNPATITDLERIARKEYSVVSFIRTPLVSSCANMTFFNPNRIFYYSFWPAGMTGVSHEIGHIAAGHDTRRPDVEQREQEADYFSARLNGISLARLETYRVLSVFIGFFNLTSLTDRRVEREINQLRRQNIPDNVIEEILRISGLRR